MPDQPAEPRPGPGAERPAPRGAPADAARAPRADRPADRAEGRAARRACPRCGAALGALSAAPGTAAESLYCGCCGLVVPAA